MQQDEKDKPQLDFMTPMEQERIKQILSGGEGDNKKREEEDGRPISRVGLCAGVEVLYAPTLMIYHVESGRWLERGVSHGAISTREKRELALEKWEKGESLGVSWTGKCSHCSSPPPRVLLAESLFCIPRSSDILYGLRWALLFSAIGITYFFLVRFDDAYNVVHLVERFMAGPSLTTTPPPPPITTSVPSHQYVEF